MSARRCDSDNRDTITPAAVIHGRSNVTLKSLLVSKHYLLAMVCSLLEYIIEIALVPELKENWVISDLGLTLVVIGEIIRKMGILTAGKAFTHLIKIYHEEQHQLITHGYCGFLIWSVGTQIMLCNPISTIAFAAVVWHFFAKRIPYEEYFLRQFFGRDYEQYAHRVGSGVPFIIHVASSKLTDSTTDNGSGCFDQACSIS
ncbi:putative protein-S-isoprenylcysteine O-methyltransferase, partial [Mucuna pruriens]